MKKGGLFLCLLVIVCLTACRAPQPAGETPAVQPFEQQLSEAFLQYRQAPQEAQRLLLELGVQILDGVQTQNSSHALAVWQLQHGEKTLLFWQITCLEQERAPASLDELVLSWQGAAYHSACGDGRQTTVKERTEQSIGFNVQDNTLAAGESCFGMVETDGGATQYEARFFHTQQIEKTLLRMQNNTLSAVTVQEEQVWELAASVPE